MVTVITLIKCLEGPRPPGALFFNSWQYLRINVKNDKNNLQNSRHDRFHDHQSAGVLREGERRIDSLGCRTGFSMHVNIILLIIILILVHHFSFGDLVVLLMLLKCFTEQR